jgi:hypothetical protein
MASSGGENMSYGKGKLNAQRMAKFRKTFKEERKISIGEGDRIVVDDGCSMGLGAKEIVVRLLVVEET